MAEIDVTVETEGRRHSEHDHSRQHSRSSDYYDNAIEKNDFVDIKVEELQEQTRGNDREREDRVEVSPPSQHRAEVAVTMNSREVIPRREKSKKPAKKQEPCLTMKDKSDRDPNRIAENVHVTFEDIIAEPDLTLYSFDQVWSVSQLVYTETKLWVYRVVTLLFGVLLAIIWGLLFALLSFAASWICVPCMKCYKLSINCCKPYYVITLDCSVEPLIKVISKIFYNIRVTNVHGSHEA